MKLAGIGLLACLLWLSLPSTFFTQKYLISHDTPSYTNAPGITEGFGLSSFSTSLRTPGYPLFLFFVTFGEIPHSDTIKGAFCGVGYFKNRDKCDDAAARLNTDITLKFPPAVYGFSQHTGELFQRIITISRVSFIISLFIFYMSLIKRCNVLLSVLVIVFIVNSMKLMNHTLFQDLLGTESLFPTAFFLYLSAILNYLNSGRTIWALSATLLALFSGLVRPALLYVPVLHLFIILPIAVYRREWIFATFGLLLTLATFIWLIFWSPITYFSTATYENDLLRTAVISDQATIDCVSDPSEKALLTAYLKSIDGATSAKRGDGIAQYYVQRYFDFALSNSYAIYAKGHPIYDQPGFTWPDGQIPTEIVRNMLRSAKACNLGRNIEYTAVNVAMMLGLTPVLSPVHAPRFFFTSPWVFVDSAILIVLALGIAIVRRDGWWLAAISISSTIYFGTILIVALEQGGDARYCYIVEPLFEFSSAISAAYLIEGWLTRVRYHGLFNRAQLKLWPRPPSGPETRVR